MARSVYRECPWLMPYAEVCNKSGRFRNRKVHNCTKGVFRSAHRTLLLACLQAMPACILAVTSLQVVGANFLGLSGASLTALCSSQNGNCWRGYVMHKVMSEGLKDRNMRSFCSSLSVLLGSWNGKMASKVSDIHVHFFAIVVVHQTLVCVQGATQQLES